MNFGRQNWSKIIRRKNKNPVALNKPKSSIKSNEEQISAHFNTKEASARVHGAWGQKESTVTTGPKEGRGEKGQKNNGKYL